MPARLVSLLLPWRFNISRRQLPGSGGRERRPTLAPGDSFEPPARKYIPRQAPFPAAQYVPETQNSLRARMLVNVEHLRTVPDAKKPSLDMHLLRAKLGRIHR